MTLVSALVTKDTPEKRLIFQKNHAKIPKKANSLNFSAFTTACTGSTPTRALGLPSVSGAQPPSRNGGSSTPRQGRRRPSSGPKPLMQRRSPPHARAACRTPTRAARATLAHPLPADYARRRASHAGESRRRPHSPSGSVSRKVQPSPPPRSSSRSPSIERMRSREIASPSPTPGLRPFSASPEREKG